MINRGGENISPREIDEAMLEHPAVAQAIAFSVPHPTLGEDIAAAVVLAKDAQVTEAELRSFLRGRIAEFKVPSRMLVVDAIPKGPTGKPQRIGLHEKLAAQLKPDFEEPAGDLEKALSHYWQDLLQLAQVGRHDNFFMCGGDSLLAASLLARLRSEMNIDLSLLELFQQPTLCEQALAIQAHRSVHDREMQKLIDELEAMSDEEARVLLEQMNPRNQPDVET
jgi:aryl carrier-like protein